MPVSKLFALVPQTAMPDTTKASMTGVVLSKTAVNETQLPVEFIVRVMQTAEDVTTLWLESYLNGVQVRQLMAMVQVDGLPVQWLPKTDVPVLAAEMMRLMMATFLGNPKEMSDLYSVGVMFISPVQYVDTQVWMIRQNAKANGVEHLLTGFHIIPISNIVLPQFATEPRVPEVKDEAPVDAFQFDTNLWGNI